jgi:chromosome segregation ATPase
MARGLVYLNTLGVIVLAVLASVQWWNNRAEHALLVEEHRAHLESEASYAEARKRADSLDGDVQRLKAGVLDAQKAADEASAARLLLEGQLKTMTAERDQLKEQVAKWEAAVNERDARLTKLSSELKEARARLDEAIQRLKSEKKQ